MPEKPDFTRTVAGAEYHGVSKTMRGEFCGTTALFIKLSCGHEVQVPDNPPESERLHCPECESIWYLNTRRQEVLDAWRALIPQPSGGSDA